MRCAFLAGLFAVAASAGGAARADDLPALGEEKSYAVPAAEIAGFDFLLNRADRRVYGHDYAVSPSSIRRNLHGPWIVDNDPYSVNQLLHPYQGSIYHGFARSAGLGFWPSLGYTFAGSLGWEIAGETTPPSKNDQVASGIAGGFLGESLFRMSNLVLERGYGGAWRELAAAAISPSTGFNRIAFGERFRQVLDSKDAAYYSRVQVGASGALHQAEGPAEVKRNELLADYSIDYGLPGKPGYRYDRPWDYFAFNATASSANAVENLSTRGLLIGSRTAAGERYRGIWGLYGSYDYLAPQLFRISSTALSLGSTGELHLNDEVAVQGTFLAGVGYAGVGTLHGTRDTDYHYGATPQGLLALRVIFGNRSSIDLAARDYFVSRVAGAGTGGHDNIARIDLTWTIRVHREHRIAIKYLWSRRDATFLTLGDLSQSRATIGIYYAYLARESLGRVDWR
ncbi:MAG TPA: DUF3943 domain-containing protein [Burkholderiales bacterium]|nr:DUF3943 domain-containing protein [Burkholderiales bacterium]